MKNWEAVEVQELEVMGWMVSDVESGQLEWPMYGQPSGEKVSIV